MSKNEIELWLGTDERAYSTYADSMSKLLKASAADLVAMSAGVQRAGAEYESRLLSVEGNLGVVKISGSMTYEESEYLQYFGMVSYSEIYDAVIEAAISPDIHEIVMMYDTTGGTTKGIDTAIEGITEAKTLKPVHTYTNGDMLSAGYWLGSAGTTVTMSEGASVGSIGVIGVVQTMAELYKKEGIAVHVFRSSPDKAPISPFEDLSEKAAEQMQEEVDFLAGKFIQAVGENLGLAPEYVKQTFGGGKVYRSDEALNLGMVGKVQSYNEYFREKLSSENNSQHGQSYGTLNAGGTSVSTLGDVPDTGSQHDITGNEMSKLSKVITAQDQAAALEGVELSAEQLAVAQAAEVAAKELEANTSSGNKGDEETKTEGESDESGSEQILAGDSGALALMAGKFAEAVEQAAGLKAKVEQLTASAVLNDGLLEQMSKVTAESINRMGIILGRGAQDLSEVTAGNLLQMHTEAQAAVIKQIPVGQRSQGPTDDDAVDKAVEAVGEQFAHLTTR